MDKRDEELMKEYLSGDKDALSMIFQRFKKIVFHYAYRTLGNRADAEDVTSDVFLRITDGKYKPSPQAKFTTWLFTVTHNVCIDRIRQRKNVISFLFKNPKTGEEEEWDIEDPRSLPDGDAEQKETARIIRRAIQKLPLDQKEALILREYHQMSYIDIGRVLGRSLENVKVLIFRARQNLKKELPSLLKEDLHG